MVAAPQKFFSVKRRHSGASIGQAQGELVLSIHPEIFQHRWRRWWQTHFIIPMVQSLVTFFTHLEAWGRLRWLWLSTMGLGLGLGMSLVVFQTPNQSQALPSQIVVERQSWLQADRVKFHKTGAQLALTTTRQVGSLTDGSWLQIELAPETVLRDSLTQTTLGDLISVQASNRGWYTYGLIETRLVPTNQVANLAQDRNNSVIFTTSANLFQTESKVWLFQRVN